MSSLLLSLTSSLCARRLISLFLATKTHSTPISLAQFASRVTPSAPSSSSSSSSSKAQEERQAAIAETSSSILDNEFEVASVLGWHFRVTHGFEGVRGLAIDLQRVMSRAGGVAQDVGNRTIEGTEEGLAPELLERIKVLLDIASQQLRLTAAEFLYTPSQLALGTWSSLTEEGGEGKSGVSASPSTLTSEERSMLRNVLQRWIDEREPLLSSSSSSSTLPLSLRDVAQQIATYVRQGRAAGRLRLASGEGEKSA
ncbi:hypothetical protein BCV69DRAFT_78775 [Microstroma glucosiphilum]|uniref:Uncharacterized protein n=1 Tax=Pseudomicrostroma glucosiphilum TaxID=1684307 RepID=A0A316TY24_9BASI|nr:hypothetical protein BCV69DRAFT_78775 [Pseudomicrostroma glucosiphilum]PWN18216.1 hypothetical protein BCV69DRAFT_78775 [Pseudomicrostroma glucosiphilum]